MEEVSLDILTPADKEAVPSARSDLADALGWLGLGAAVLIGSIRMDRLQDQDINPYTIPGLLPGLLGIALLLMGAVLAWRSWSRGAWTHDGGSDAGATGSVRLFVVIALCVAFDTALVGHGLPFWVAASVFVTVAILALQQGERRAAGPSLTLRAVATAALIGLGAGGGVSFLFQSIFLVHLP